MTVPKVNNDSTAHNPVGRFMVAVGAVLELDTTGKILLVQRQPALDWRGGEWEIVYGRIAQFESPEVGLRREIKEEIGVEDLEIVKYLRVWHMFRGHEETAENELVGITYHCRTQTQHIELSEEHTNYQWVDLDEALKVVSIDGIKEDLQRFEQARR